MTTTVTRNIGLGGAFVLSENPLPVGTELVLAIRVPTRDEPIELMAEVRWLIPADEDADGSGMGVQFLDIDVDTLLALNNYFASLAGTDVVD